jgi:hypothetical protein
MDVLLTKVSSDHKNLRTSTVEGHCNELPEVGERFVMFGKGLVAGVRYVETSIVQDLIQKDEKTILFSTEFSEYKLEVT